MSCLTAWLPMYPAPPVTSTFIAISSHWLRAEGRPLLDRHGDTRLHEIERLADDDVHVEVAIGPEAADECDPLLLLGEPHVLSEKRFVVREPERIVRRVAGLGELTELAE